MKTNPQFADGIGTGLGYIFTISRYYISKRYSSKSTNSAGEMSRGLGFGFGLRFPLMDQKEMVETYSKADIDPEFDNGFGMGLLHFLTNFGSTYHVISLKAR